MNVPAIMLPPGSMGHSVSLHTTPTQLYEATPVTISPPFPFNRYIAPNTPRPLVPSPVMRSQRRPVPTRKPTHKGKETKLREDARRGAGVRAYVAASQLWGRLGGDTPRMPDPQGGCSQQAIDAARMGREHVRIGIGASAARASEGWRSRRRTQLRNGCRE